VRAALLALLLSAAGCGGGPQAEIPQDFPVPVEMAKAEARPMQEVLSLVGTLEADESVLLKPEISGRIAAIQFDEGQRVEAGALLVQLDDSETAAELREAEADVSFAQAEHARRADLYRQRVVSKQELERAKAELDRITARVEIMKAKLGKTRIRAPFAGIVGARRVSPGMVVDSGDTLANFEAIDLLKLNFEVPERYLPRIGVGQPVDLKVVAFPGRQFRGVVYFIDPRISRTNRSVGVKARVPNSDRLLRPGMFANIDLLIEEKSDAVAIPEQALVPMAGQQFVFRVKPDSTVDLVPVKTGIRDEGVVEITSGLSSGDTVVAAGHQKIGPGSRVVPFGQPPPGEGAPAPDAPPGEEAGGPA
jgi:membrane fusion protein (multidrug efflux system)